MKSIKKMHSYRRPRARIEVNLETQAFEAKHKAVSNPIFHLSIFQKSLFHLSVSSTEYENVMTKRQQ